jgi:hypothetical protein
MAVKCWKAIWPLLFPLGISASLAAPALARAAPRQVDDERRNCHRNFGTLIFEKLEQKRKKTRKSGGGS